MLNTAKAFCERFPLSVPFHSVSFTITSFTDVSVLSLPIVFSNVLSTPLSLLPVWLTAVVKLQLLKEHMPCLWHKAQWARSWGQYDPSAVECCPLPLLLEKGKAEEHWELMEIKWIVASPTLKDHTNKVVPSEGELLQMTHSRLTTFFQKVRGL